MIKEQDRNQPNKPIIQDDEIDLLQLVKTIWAGRITIYYSIGICVLIGLIIAFTSPAKYTASATLLPSEEKRGGNMGNLGALAGMAGINLSSMMGDASGIPADLYPQIIGSYPFQKELIRQKFKFEEFEKNISIYEYVLQDTVPTIGAILIKYTVRLPWTIKDAIFSSNEKDAASSENSEINVLNLSDDELKALGFVNGIASINVDNKSGLVSIAVEMGQPVLTAQVAQSVVDLLQQYIINYKTEQVRQNLEFVEARYREKKDEFDIAQKAFFEYKDRHRNMISERMNSEYQELSDAYEIAGSVYKGLAQQMEQARIKVKEETPVFTVLEPVMVPIEKSAPKKKIILVMCVFLGGFIGLGVIFGQIILRKFR